MCVKGRAERRDLKQCVCERKGRETGSEAVCVCERKGRETGSEAVCV